MNIANELLSRAKATFGANHIISYYKKNGYSVKEYSEVSDELKSWFEDLNVLTNTITILQFDDNPTAISVFLACIKYGVVPLLISKKTDIETVLKDITPSAVITDDYNELKKNQHNLTLLYVSYEKYDLRKSCINFSKNDFSKIESEKVAYLGMTSGSSGTPKYVMHGHSEMLFASDSFGINTLKLTKNDTIYSVPKMSFTYGLANSLFFSFVSGAPAILVDEKYSAQTVIDTLVFYKPTCFFAVPSIYGDLIQLGTANEYFERAFASVRLCVSSGEALKKEIIEKWFLLTKNFISDSVGCSETGSGFLFNDNPREKTGSVGVPVCGYQLHLLVGDGLKGGDEGILCVSGKSNAVGYYNNILETEKKFMDGWVKTGDIFRLDDDGYYWYIGREDGMFKYHGMWVSRIKVENIISSFAGITDCCVVNSKHNSVNCITAFICTNSDFLGVEALKQHLSRKLTKYEMPTSFCIKESIPLNSNGKKNLPELESEAKNIIDHCQTDEDR